jgi:hypothetical protein
MSDPSVVVLVQNEEYFLPFVLTQLEGHFDRAVIYDVASTDRTREIIDWWEDRVKGEIDTFIRRIDNPVEPEAQGAFRNAMTLEGGRDIYWILDGDELYTQKDLSKISKSAEVLNKNHKIIPAVRYGVFKRVEVSEDLKRQYCERRSHHRLYTSDASWTGTHPGEVPLHKQNKDSEIYFDITCWHMHNTQRSTKDDEALRRINRRQKRTHHPGSTMGDLDLLSELPRLREPIEDFPVSPALAALQAKI